jgi:hypothetical protein
MVPPEVLGDEMMHSMSRVRLAHAIAAVALSCGCAQAAPSLDTIAEGYVRVTLQLAQHNPELIEDWRGPASWRPGPRQPVAPLLQRITTLQQNLRLHSDRATEDRRGYLAAQLAALELSAQRLLGQSAPFDDEAERAFGRRPATAPAARLEATRAALARELPGQGSLVERYEAFKKRQTVDVSKAEPLMRAALAACRTVTASALALPGDESIELAFADGSPWDAFAQYLGDHRTRITFNRRAAVDVSRVLRLACHEGYPGHHVQFMLIDDELARRRGWHEFELTPAFGRHLLVTEGAAEAGAEMAFPFDARVAVYRDVLLPIAGLPPQDAAQLARVDQLVWSLEPAAIGIIRGYLDNTLTQAVAIDRLRIEALTLDPEALLAFAERRRTKVLAYAEGRDAIWRTIGRDNLKALHALFVEHPFAVK